jgi:hypothetical protein
MVRRDSPSTVLDSLILSKTLLLYSLQAVATQFRRSLLLILTPQIRYT